MFDPLSPLAAPPPRYLLESDSSDEEGQGAYPSSQHARPQSRAPRVAVRRMGDASDTSGGSVSAAVIGIGQAGRYLQRAAGARAAALEVEVDGQRVGTGFDLEGGLLVVLAEVDTAAAFGVAEALVQSVEAGKWTLVSSYVPSMYIPAPGEHVSAEHPVRGLSRSATSAGVKPYDAPNYVTGLAGAFLSLATHPAFSLSDADLVLLPLPLSALPPASLATALETLPTPLAARLARPAHWREVDDEPFSAPGMGKQAKAAKVTEREAPDLAGMYM